VVTPATYALSACNLVLLTSVGEGTPNVLLEAQSLGLPVVTTDAGGAPEAVLDGITGYVVRKGGPDKIAEAVLRVMQDAEFCTAVRRHGPAFIEERYGLDRMIRETLSLYRRHD
jgi:glycosyltransferase involved in cell wall biosynthesis